MAHSITSFLSTRTAELGNACIFLPPREFTLTGAGEAAVSLSLVRLRAALGLLVECSACRASSSNLISSWLTSCTTAVLLSRVHTFISQDQVVNEGEKSDTVN